MRPSGGPHIITGDLPPATVEGVLIDDVLIEAEGVLIDGPGRILGQAGPTHIRPASNLPVKGIMSFDTADLARMVAPSSNHSLVFLLPPHHLPFGAWQK